MTVSLGKKEKMSKEVSFASLPGLAPFSYKINPLTAGRCLGHKLLKALSALDLQEIWRKPVFEVI